MHTIIDADGLLYQSAYGVKNVEEAFVKFTDKVTQLTTHNWDQDGECTLILEGPGNWRKDVFEYYKAPRKKIQAVDPNAALRWELSSFLKQEGLAIAACGMETDDLVRRKAVTMMKRGQPFIVASADKDLDLVVGPHIRFDTKWNLREYEITEEQSDYNFFYQLMIGDGQDNIKSPKLLGPKTAEKLLKENPRDKWRDIVEREYKERCGNEWEHALYFTGSLVYIQETQDEMFQWRDGGTWWDKGFQGAPQCYGYTNKQKGE